MRTDPRVPFWLKVDRQADDKCWPWRGEIRKDGYGVHGGHMAHRVAWERTRGPVPDGLELDHLCRNHSCVNPSHLEPVTHAENMRRRYAEQTHCTNGHPFDEENTYWRTDAAEGRRGCRACNRDAARRYRSRRAAA